MSTDTTLGGILRAARAQRGQSLREAAAGAGLSHVHLRTMENNHVLKPSEATLLKLAQHYGLDFTTLMQAITPSPIPRGDGKKDDDSTGGSPVGDALRAARARKGETLRQVAQAADISNSYISQVENGHVLKPSLDVLFKLAQHYGISYPELMELAGYPQGQPEMTFRLKEEQALRLLEHLQQLIYRLEEDAIKDREYIARLNGENERLLQKVMDLEGVLATGGHYVAQEG